MAATAAAEPLGGKDENEEEGGGEEEEEEGSMLGARAGKNTLSLVETDHDAIKSEDRRKEGKRGE